MLKLFISIFCTLLISSHLYAGEVLRVKNKSIIFDLAGESLASGDRVDIFQGAKKRGVARIQKISRDKTKAMATIVMGQARKGWMATNNDPNAIKDAEPSTAKSSSGKKARYGLLLGLSQDNMTVSLASGDKDLSGNGFSAKAVMDYALGTSLQVRAKSGIETFDASGNVGTLADACQTCEAKITYFTLEGIGQWYFNQGDYRFWLGGGAAVVHPMSGSSNAVDVEGISTTTAIQLGGGMDIRLKSGRYIPLEFSYSMLPKSDSVQANYLNLSFGYMF